MEKKRGKSHWEQDDPSPAKPKPKSRVAEVLEKSLPSKGPEVSSSDSDDRVETIRAAQEAAKLASRKALEAKFTKSRRKQSRMENLQGTGLPPATAGAVRDLEKLWYTNMVEKFPDLPVAKGFSYAQKNQMAEIVERYSKEEVHSAVDYMFFNWDHISRNFFKGKALRPELPMLFKLHDRFILDAAVWKKYDSAAKAMKVWNENSGPIVTSPPEDLSRNYAAAREMAIKAGIIEG